MIDPFQHHPGLRDLIKDPLKSFFRDFSPEDMDKVVLKHGGQPDWRLSDETREACRRRTLAGRRDRDLWVFAYGSLMWDPAIQFAEVRRAHAPDYARRFILKDVLGGRGIPEAPGLMAALDRGDGCNGLAFRIRKAELEVETERLWRRERVAPAYVSRFIPVHTDPGPVEALAFIADYSAPIIDPELSWRKQVEYCATGRGFLGSSFEYVDNLVRHFTELRIKDDDLTRLWKDAQAFNAEPREIGNSTDV